MKDTDKVYKNVELGAKKGTINDREDRFKYDGLTAYVLPPNGKKGICIPVLGIHGKTLGRAGKSARSQYYPILPLFLIKGLDRRFGHPAINCRAINN